MSELLLSQNRNLESNMHQSRKDNYLLTIVLFSISLLYIIISIFSQIIKYRTEGSLPQLFGAKLGTKKYDIPSMLSIILCYGILISFSVSNIYYSSTLYKGEGDYYLGIIGEGDYNNGKCNKQEENTNILKILQGCSILAGFIVVILFSSYSYRNNTELSDYYITSMIFSSFFIFISFVCTVDYALKITNFTENKYKCNTFFPSK